MALGRGPYDILWEDEEEVENVGSESDEAGNGNSESGEVENNDSGGDEVGNCEDSETIWCNWIKARDFMMTMKETQSINIIYSMFSNIYYPSHVLLY
jgi:hypothetical protein